MKKFHARQIGLRLKNNLSFFYLTNTSGKSGIPKIPVVTKKTKKSEEKT